MNILLTGSSGYLGKNLTKYLAKKNKVFTFDRKSQKFSLENVKSYLYPKTINGYVKFLKKNNIKVIIHNAGYFIKNHKINDIDKLIEVDIKLSLYIFESAKISGIKSIISFGSYWQYYSNKNIFKPANLYACTKQSIHTIAEHYLNNHDISHLQLLIHDTYGANDKRNKIINKLFKLSKNQKFIINNPDAEIYPLHVEDVCDAIEFSIKFLARNKKPFNKQYSLRSNNPIKILKLITIISKIRQISFENIEFKKNYNKIINSKMKRLPYWKPKINLKKGLDNLK